MYTVHLSRPDDFEGWRQASREHLIAGTPPEAITWESGGATADLFGGQGVAPTAERLAATGARRHALPTVSRRFLELAECVACHRDANRFARLYRVLWRVVCGETHLLDQSSDTDMHRLHQMARNVARERHKMHAFVRFRQTPGVRPEHFFAWFEPLHHTLRLSSGFFVRRFANMHWSIVTPEESAHWDGRQLRFGAGGTRGDAPDNESMETLWRTYFSSIFNPARLKPEAMQSEMPVRYWKNLPEASLISDLIQQANARSEAMIRAAPSPPSRRARATRAHARTSRSARS